MTNNLCRFTHALKRSCRILTNTIRKRTSFSNFKRSYSSALYISGNKAYKSFAYLSPYLDFDERFANMDKLQKELVLRGMDMDAVQLRRTWDFYKQVAADKLALENHNIELRNRKNLLLEVTERTAEEEQELRKLEMQIPVIWRDMKVIKEAIWELDETVIEKLLKLPNELDPRTPTGEPIVLKSIGGAPKLSEKNRSHIEIGTNLDLLEYKDPLHCYLCNDAALFELAVLACASHILGERDMLKVIGTDFSRSLVVEASGLNHEDPAAAFLLHDHNEVERDSPNRMHLVGGASLAAFLILHTKQMINPRCFPLKYYSTGRQYTPLPRNSHACGLFATCQASVAHVFAMVKDARSQEYETLFEELLETVCTMYDRLCDHYRVVKRSASELQPCEGLRVSFEMWSPSANQYIEIGHLSACGDYFSKRLLIAYQTPSGRDFPVVITGTVLSVPRLLACLLEQNPDKFVIPPKVAEFMP